MSRNGRDIPDVTLEVLARNFFREAAKYGFGFQDYLRFVNLIMSLSMNNSAHGAQSAESNHSESAGSNSFEMSNLSIRPFDLEADRLVLKRWLDEPAARHFLLSRQTSLVASLDQLLSDQSNIFGVITLDESRPIGAMAFLGVDPVQRKAELRKLIGEPSMRGRGLGKEATRRWIQFGFEKLGLHKIYLNTFNAQLRNIRINEELGFTVEGILRDEVYFDGRYHDVLRMALCSDTRTRQQATMIPQRSSTAQTEARVRSNGVHAPAR